jgi:hypothetical protein
MAMIPIYKGDPKVFRINPPSNVVVRRQKCADQKRAELVKKRGVENMKTTNSLPIIHSRRTEGTRNGSPPLEHKFFCFHDVHRAALPTIIEEEHEEEEDTSNVVQYKTLPVDFDVNLKTSIYCGTISSPTIWDKMVNRLTNVLSSNNSRYDLRRHGVQSTDSPREQSATFLASHSANFAAMKSRKNVNPDATKYLEAEVSPTPFGEKRYHFQSRW